MISWFWAVLSLLVGILLGLFLAALLEAGEDDEITEDEEDGP